MKLEKKLLIFLTLICLLFNTACARKEKIVYIHTSNECVQPIAPKLEKLSNDYLDTVKNSEILINNKVLTDYYINQLINTIQCYKGI